MITIPIPLEYELDDEGYPTEKGMYQLLKQIRDNCIQCDSLRLDLSYTIGYLLGNRLNINFNTEEVEE